MSLQYLNCPTCQCPMTCMQSTTFHMLSMCQTEEHKAKQKEHDDGIIHKWNCKMEVIEIPNLILNPKFINSEVHD